LLEAYSIQEAPVCRTYSNVHFRRSPFVFNTDELSLHIKICRVVSSQ